MNENINLYKILKGHEGEIFYSPLCGNVELISVDNKHVHYPIRIKCNNGVSAILTNEGKYYKDNKGEMQLFPSEDQRDWLKWDKENNHETPKTWSELVKNNKVKYRSAQTDSTLIDDSLEVEDYSFTNLNTPIEKAALALLRIHQLIEVGYGGNVTDEIYESWTIDPHGFCPVHNDFGVRHILFHTKEQAEEFLSYEENIQLLKDYFMINN